MKDILLKGSEELHRCETTRYSLYRMYTVQLPEYNVTPNKIKDEV